MRAILLGCGASAGVPLIGCHCEVCTSQNPRNRRSRMSLYLETQSTRLIVDTPPDMRDQLLRHRIAGVDAVLYTHAHADHTHGIDDTRAFNYYKNAPVPIYGDAKTLAEIQARFAYAFQPPKPSGHGWFRPCLVPQVIAPEEPLTIGDLTLRFFPQQHGTQTSLGLRIGDFAYSTDVSDLPEEAFAALKGVTTWVVDCLRHTPAPTHSHLEKTLAWIRRVKPREAYLIHMNHEMDYDSLCATLPAGVFPAYDGLTFEGL